MKNKINPDPRVKSILIRAKNLFIMDIMPDSSTSIFIEKFNIGTRSRIAKPSNMPPIIKNNTILNNLNLKRLYMLIIN